MAGWIKLHRKIINWEWYTEPNVFALFMHLLLTVNHEESRYKGYVIPRGSRVAGRIKLSQETGISEQGLRTAIDKLKSTGEITSKSTNKFSIITVCNYDKYQCSNEPEQPANQPAINQPSTTSKEVKKKEINIFVPPSPEEVHNYCLERKNNVDPEKFIDHYMSNGWMVGKNKMKDWRASVRTWEKSTPKPKGQKIGGLTFE